MGVLTFDGPADAVVNLLDTNQGTVKVVNSSASAAVPVLPFRANFYVDPLFVGTSTGSQSNPFTTFAAAFAAAAAQALPSGTISIPAGSSIAENVTIPTTGEWTIQGLTSPGNLSSCSISANVDISATAARRVWIRDIRISGNVTGNTSNGTHRITFERVNVVGSTTLTVSGSGTLRLGTLGGVSGGFLVSSNMGYSFFSGPVAVQGTVWASYASFQSTLSCSGRCNFFSSNFGGNITTTAEANDDNDLAFDTCLTTTPISINVSQTVGGRLALISGTDSSLDGCTFNFSGIGINVFSLDAATANSLVQHGATLTGTVSNGPGTMARVRLTGRAANIGATIFAFKCPIPQMRVNGTLTLAAAGTAGAALLNVGYTDSLGVARTKAVTPALNIAGAVGDEVQGTVLFTQDGSTSFTYSVTGIVTPGALSYNLAISLEPGQ